MVELQHASVVEHSSSRAGRWLRARRIKLALWIAVAEGILIAFDVIPWWAAIAIAACALVLYVMVGRTARSDAVQQGSWVAAASQALVVLVPILVLIVGSVALIAVGLLAVLALIFLFADRK